MKLEDLRYLCAKYWNPIGVPMGNVTTHEQLGFRPLPEDEYDSYLLYAARLIRDGRSREEIYEYFNTVERQYLMLSHPAGNLQLFIDKLFEI